MSRLHQLLSIAVLVCCLHGWSWGQEKVPHNKGRLGVAEARTRARILHETIHGTLQVVHRDFFRKDDAIKIPSRSLEDVFQELKKQHNIELRWIAVDLEPMNIDNAPESKFERQAATKLKEGKREFELVNGNMFQYAAKIMLSATCLSCHAPRRSGNQDRFAGLVIQMPLTQKVADKKGKDGQ